jgi:hypothetical protein
MPQVSVNLSYAVDGISYAQTGLVSGEGKVERIKSNFPAAVSGTLTVRTDNDTGTISFAEDPGISAGSRLDVYWAGGARRGMKATSISGTGPWLVVVGNAVGDVGVGDNLPVQDTVVTVGKVQSWDFNVIGNNIKALIASASAKATIVLASGTDTEEWAAVFEEGAGVKGWFEGNGETNPIVGDTITKIFMSHGDTSGTKEVKAVAVLT